MIAVSASGLAIVWACPLISSPAPSLLRCLVSSAGPLSERSQLDLMPCFACATHAARGQIAVAPWPIRIAALDDAHRGEADLREAPTGRDRNLSSAHGHRDCAHEVAFSKLDAAIAQDCVCCGEVKVEVRQNEVI